MEETCALLLFFQIQPAVKVDFQPDGKLLFNV